MQKRFTPGHRPPQNCQETPLWFVFQEDRLLVHIEGEDPLLPRVQAIESLGVTPSSRHFMGFLDQAPCYAARVAPGTEAPKDWEWQGLRAITAALGVEMIVLAGAARQVLDWDDKNRFCGACGKPMVMKTEERAKECPNCGQIRYPRISPAVIMAVSRGREILLGRSPRFPQGMYSVLAGFVELGETLEQTVAREVKEETGVTVRNIRYFGSQPWPFPDSLMIGFTAEYESGEINADPAELEDARWFSPEDLPRIPSRETIARRLIDDFLVRGQS